MTQVFISRKIPQTAANLLASKYSIISWEKETPPVLEDLLGIAPEIDGMFSMLTDPLTDQFFRAATKIRAISQMAVGTDNIDMDAATRSGIPVGHTPDVLTEACADHTWALLLAVARRITESNDEVRSGIWRPWGPDVLCGEDVHGATLGVVGYGRIGQAVAKRALGFSMQILYTSSTEHGGVDESIAKVDLHELLIRSDYVTLHVPLTEKTRGMISKAEFQAMKRNAIIINASRGPVVDSKALIWALNEQLIRGAGLDVFDPEPIPGNHPLLSYPNVIITPHIASATHETRKKMSLVAATNLIAGLEGKRMPYCANPQVYASPGK